MLELATKGRHEHDRHALIPGTSDSRPRSRLDGSDAMNPDPDYSAAYVVIRTDAADGIEGHGFVFTIGRGNEVAGRGDRRAPRAPHRAGRRAAPRRHGCGVAPARARLPAALARPREGRHAHGDRRRRQRAVGPQGEARRPAALAAARAAHPRRDRRARRLPLPHRRAHPRRGARAASAPRSPAGPSATAELLRDRLSRLHDDARLARIHRREARATVP